MTMIKRFSWNRNESYHNCQPEERKDFQRRMRTYGENNQIT